MKPIIKWAGGKTRLLRELSTAVDDLTGGHWSGTYREPFMGGGALFFHLLPGPAVLSDSNGALIAMYRGVRDEPDRVHETYARLRSRSEADPRASYIHVRAKFNADVLLHRVDDATCAAYFLFLARSSFNGLWRTNSRGEFNVPYGMPAMEIPPDTFREYSAALRDVRLEHASVFDAINLAAPDDLIYCDPPYDNVFTSYTLRPFDSCLRERMAARLRDLAERGCHVIVSDNDTPFVRQLYDGWRIIPVKCDRRINSNGAKRGKVGELIITSKGF